MITANKVRKGAIIKYNGNHYLCVKGGRNNQFVNVDWGSEPILIDWRQSVELVLNPGMLGNLLGSMRTLGSFFARIR